jgi:hypothetical protein
MHCVLKIDSLLCQIFRWLDIDDIESVAAVCRDWKKAARWRQTDLAEQLMGKSIDWAIANDGVVAGSMALYAYLHLYGIFKESCEHSYVQYTGRRLEWFPSDADVFIFPGSDSKTRTINAPTFEELPDWKHGGELATYGSPVVSSVKYPFGTVQVIYIGAMLEWNSAPSFKRMLRTCDSPIDMLLESFDHSACMLALKPGATWDDTTFHFGPRFSIEPVTMYRQQLCIERYEKRKRKYTARGFAPAREIDVEPADDPWIHCYRAATYDGPVLERPWIRDLE